jgi:SAM-dependent methyltransferase
MIRKLIKSSARKLTSGADMQRTRKRLLNAPELDLEQKTLLRKATLKIHPHDGMYVPFQAEHYLRVGLGAIACINKALAGTNASPQRILDLPCGHGRVMRFVKARFPEAELFAMEIDVSGIEFCGKTFSARMLRSQENFDALNLDQRFDLVWCGSLLTHITEATAASLLRFFHRHLSINGVCVFTTAGKYSAELLRTGALDYGLAASEVVAALKQYDQSGFGFGNYPGDPGYGITLINREKINGLASAAGAWNEVLFEERGWDNHQDVYAFRRNS